MDVVCPAVTGDLFVVAYSVDSRETFDEARRLQDQMFLAKGSQSAFGGRTRTPYVPHVIVGNKTDRESERVVDASELKALVDRYPNCCGGVETSAKRNHNVDEVPLVYIDSESIPDHVSAKKSAKTSH